MKKYIKQHTTAHLVMLTLLMIVTLSTALAAYKLSDMINALEQSSLKPAIVSLVAYVALQIVSIVALSYNNKMEAKIKQKIRMDIRKKIIHNSVSYSMSDFYQKDNDDFTDVQISSLEVYSQDYLGNIYNAIYFAFLVLFGIIVFAFMDPLFSALLVVAVLLSYFVSKRYENKVYKVATNFIDAKNKYNGFISDIMNGFVSFYTFHVGNFFLSKGKEKANAYESQLRDYRFKVQFVGTVTYLPMFFADFILLSVIILSVITGRTGLGTLAAFLNIGGMILNSGEGLFGCLAYLKSGQSALENEIINYEPELISKKTKDMEKERSAISYGCEELFSFANVSYHIDEKEILKPKDFIINRGDKVIITGTNGSGKTTLLRMISKLLIPSGGEIRYKGISYSKLGEEDIFSDIAYLRQESYLFEGTLYENIFFKETVNEDIQHDIIHKAALDDFLSNHKEGFSYHIEANGANLSGGEKRRICIARTLAQQKSILLLDEPTAGIDELNARKIESMLMNTKDLTVIMITHDIRYDIYGDYKEIVF